MLNRRRVVRNDITNIGGSTYEAQTYNCAAQRRRKAVRKCEIWSRNVDRANGKNDATTLIGDTGMEKNAAIVNADVHAHVCKAKP